MTPGSTPPCSSFIVPVTLPPDNCPNAVPVTRSKNNKHTIPFAKLIVSSLQISRYYGDDLRSLPAISYFLVLTDRLGQHSVFRRRIQNQKSGRLSIFGRFSASLDFGFFVGGRVIGAPVRCRTGSKGCGEDDTKTWTLAHTGRAAGLQRRSQRQLT